MFVDASFHEIMRGKLYLPHESEHLSLRTPSVYPSFGAYLLQWSSSASCRAPWLWPNLLTHQSATQKRVQQLPKLAWLNLLCRSSRMVSISCHQCHMAQFVRSGMTWPCSIFRIMSGTPLTSCSIESPGVICRHLTPKTPMASQVIHCFRSTPFGAVRTSITQMVSCKSREF